jgi:hypothetical protein
MKRQSALWRHLRLMIGLGVVTLGLAMVTPAQAGGVDVSIGIGLPVPMVVAPAPVVVAPPPVVVYPPAVVAPPPMRYGYPLPPGLAKKYDRYPPYYGGKFYRHKHRGWDD